MAIGSGNAFFGVSINFRISKSISGMANQLAVAQDYSSKAAYTSIGNNASQFSEIYSAVVPIANNSSVTLDLYGSLTNQLGETINFARIKSIAVELLNVAQGGTNANSVTVGGASNAFNGPLGGTTPTFDVASGGGGAFWRSDATGWPVTNATGDQFKILNNDTVNNAACRVTMIGATS